MLIDTLPGDALAMVIEAMDDGGSCARALACCCHDLTASLKLVRPFVSVEVARPDEALLVEASGLWRLRALTLLGSDAEMQKVGCSSNVWDIFAITASSQAATHRDQLQQRSDSPRQCVQLSLLARCAWLGDVTIDGWDVGDGLAHLSTVPQLERLALRRLKLLASLAPLAAFPCLKALELTSCWRVVDLAPLAACVSLERLSLHRYQGRALVACPALRAVSVREADRLCDLWALSGCTRLEDAHFAVCHGVDDLSPLADCAALRKLQLECCIGVRSLAPLGACAELRAVSLVRCPCLTDLSALTACGSLQRLAVVECKGLAHFSTPHKVVRALRNSKELRRMDGVVLDSV